MKQTELIMGMPITIEVIDKGVTAEDVNTVFSYFRRIDNRYSTYKPNSEISRINEGLPEEAWSAEMKRVLRLCEETKQLTDGYFDIKHNDKLDPSGLVKGWAINHAARLFRLKGAKNFYIEAGGDIQANGKNADKHKWAVGIRNPFNIQEIIKVVGVSTEGVATSGTYIRGEHIYDPHHGYKRVQELKSLTVIGPNVYEADRFATAAFAMGPSGINFIESLSGFEGYMVDKYKTATFTSGFERYVIQNA